VSDALYVLGDSGYELMHAEHQVARRA
jgi:hypothetical protein